MQDLNLTEHQLKEKSIKLSQERFLDFDEGNYSQI
jgi:hypothetical protein